MTSSINYDQLVMLVQSFKSIYPDAYGYTDKPTGLYLLFRDREESFDKTQAVVTIKYRKLKQ